MADGCATGGMTVATVVGTDAAVGVVTGTVTVGDTATGGVGSASERSIDQAAP